MQSLESKYNNSKIYLKKKVISLWNNLPKNCGEYQISTGQIWMNKSNNNYTNIILPKFVRRTVWVTAFLWALVRSILAVPVTVTHPVGINALVVSTLKHVFMALGSFWNTVCLIAILQIQAWKQNIKDWLVEINIGWTL